jgi:DNA replication protein DnaC
MMYSLKDLKLRRKTWVQIANIPTARIGWTLDDCSDITDEDMKVVRSWVSTVKSGKVIRAVGNRACGKGMLFYGTPGNGKSTLAAAILQEMMTSFSLEEFSVGDDKVLIRPCFFTTFNDVLDLKGELMDSPTEEQTIKYQGILGECPNDAYNIRVLVIDDVGKEHASLSGWQKNMLHHVLRTRFNKGLPTIITTNIKLADWAALYGDATESFANEAFAYLPINSARGDLRK